MIKIPLRIVLVEDYQIDADLITRHIKKVVTNPTIKVTDNLADFKELLTSFVPDIVLSDYNLPTCTGLDILEYTKENDNNLPFIFITGTLEDEELAANTILSGADGFILKKHLPNLHEKIRPLFKKFVFNMNKQEALREQIRRNKMTVNRINRYLDNLRSDSTEQQENLQKIRENIDSLQDDKHANDLKE